MKERVLHILWMQDEQQDFHEINAENAFYVLEEITKTSCRNKNPTGLDPACDFIFLVLCCVGQCMPGEE